MQLLFFILRIFGIKKLFTFKQNKKIITINTSTMSATMRNYLLKKGVSLKDLTAGNELTFIH